MRLSSKVKVRAEGQFGLASGTEWRILLVVASSLLRSENPAAHIMGNNGLILSTRSAARVPARWRKEVERILITDELIARRIGQMARRIEREFKGREMVVVSL